jgi:hypothetical protein
MNAFRVYLVIVLVCLTVYTLIVGTNHGCNLLPIFFADIAKMEWPGQFNFDFTFLLSLAGLWVAWRHRFSGGGIALGLVALFGGMAFLSAYLLWASSQAAGDARVLLLGKERSMK